LNALAGPKVKNKFLKLKAVVRSLLKGEMGGFLDVYELKWNGQKTYATLLKYL
jgi:hypothetical protein